jgi:hypothetical protein
LQEEEKQEQCDGEAGKIHHLPENLASERDQQQVGQLFGVVLQGMGNFNTVKCISDHNL